MIDTLKYTGFCFKTAFSNLSFVLSWITSIVYFIFVDNSSYFAFFMASYALLFDSTVHSIYPFRFILPVSINSVILSRLTFSFINCLIFVVLFYFSSGESSLSALVIIAGGLSAINVITTFIYSKKKRALYVLAVAITYALLSIVLVFAQTTRNVFSVPFAILIAIAMNIISYFIARLVAKRQQV